MKEILLAGLPPYRKVNVNTVISSKLQKGENNKKDEINNIRKNMVYIFWGCQMFQR